MLTKSKISPETTFTVPSLTDVSSDIAAIETKQRELQARLVDLDRDRASYWVAANTGPDEGGDRVAELLGDEPSTENPSRQKAKVRLVEIAAETAAVKKALEVLNKRHLRARQDASNTIVEAVRPEYAARIKALASAFCAVYRAERAYCELTWDLNAADVMWTGLIPMGSHRVIGDVRDRQSVLAWWFREAQDAGYITKEEIPVEIRP